MFFLQKPSMMTHDDTNSEGVHVHPSFWMFMFDTSTPTKLLSSVTSTSKGDFADRDPMSGNHARYQALTLRTLK
jgi:hypothetical protein